MFDGFSIPLDRVLIALRHAATVSVANAEIVLRFGAAVLGKLAPSCDCLDVSTRIEIFARFVKTVWHACLPP